MATTVVLGVLLVGSLTTGTAAAQQPDADPIVVAVRDIPPFALPADDGWTGYSVQIWESVASDLDLRTEWLEVDSVSEQIEAVQEGRADVAVGAISITEDRERVVDFSTRIYDSGIGVLVSDDLRGGASAFDVLRLMFTRVVLGVFAMLVLLAIVAGHVVWLVERRRNGDHFPHEYLPGVAQGMWWAVVTMTTVGYGDTVPRTRWGRLVTIGWIVVGIVLIAQFTAAITSVLTEERLESAVSGIGDLYGEDVATVAGTTSAEWLDSIALRAEETSDVDIALDQLLRGEVDAVVYDEPVLRRAESTNLGDRAVLLPVTYQPQGIGFALSQGSALVEPVDLELLSLGESGRIRLLDERWFGLEEGS
jgi:polar amino acid transport system substrate-binding protein